MSPTLLGPCSRYVPRRSSSAQLTMSSLASVMLAGILLSSCRGADSGVGRATAGPLRPFADYFEPVDSMMLKCDPEHDIVRLSGIAIGSEGQVVVTDPSQGNVLMFDGSDCRVLGSRGEGPGEFIVPIGPRFDELGRLHVLDPALGRISVFSTGGAFLENINTSREVPAAFGFELMAPSKYVLAGSRTTDSSIVFVLDSAGTLQSAFLPIGKARPAGTDDTPFWGTMRFPSVAVHSDSIFAAQGLIPSLFIVDAATGDVAVESIPVPGYKPPEASTSPLSPQEFRDWRSKQMLAMGTYTALGHVFVPFVNGVYFDGDPSILMERLSARHWVALVDAPPILAGSDSALWALDVPSLLDNDPGILVRSYRAR